MIVIKLHLSPICAKWLHYHLTCGNIHQRYKKANTTIYKMIYLCLEPVRPGWNKVVYEGKHELLVPIKEEQKNSVRWTRTEKPWIPPDRMKLIDGIVYRLWRYDLEQQALNRVGTIVDGKKVKQIDVIRDFVEKYDISSEELTTATAIKMIYRAKKRDNTLIDSII